MTTRSIICRLTRLTSPRGDLFPFSRDYASLGTAVNTRYPRKSLVTTAAPSATAVSDVKDASRPISSEGVDENINSARAKHGVPSNASNGMQGFAADIGNDWSRSYFGLSAEPFPKHVADVLMAPIDPLDVEMKPDGLAYLPEIKYRRILNKAFGPGGWGLAPRSETNVGPKVVSREYALVCLGRLVAVARGEQEYFDPSGIPTATEACKSNALMRCCKDLGIASELWDPRYLRDFKAKHCIEIFAENAVTKKKKKLWRRKDQPKFDYPWKE